MSKKVLASRLKDTPANPVHFIGRIGLSPDMKPYNYSKALAFNHMNFAALIIGVIRLIYILLFPSAFSQPATFLVNALPVLACVAMMISMAGRAYAFTVYFSFLVVPFLLFFITWYVHDRGIITYFVPYLVYPFFFLNRQWKIIAAFTYSAFFFMGSFILEIFHDHTLHGHAHDLPLEFISLVGSMVLSFITLYSIKSQVWQNERKIQRQKTELEAMNSDIRKEQEKLKESNRVKDKLFSIISHDLRVPIQGLYLMLSNESEPESTLAVLSDNLPELRAELKKTSQLFDDLLDWSRLQISNSVFHPQKIDMAELADKVREALHFPAIEKNIRVELEIKDACLYADRDMIEIVLRNLVSNAIKFTPSRGAVSVTGQLEQNTYTLRVEDNGIGIDAAALERIMERQFYTTYGTRNEKGSGLGLLICCELVEKCEGFLSIHSTVGKGTKVSVSIPNQPASQQAKQEQAGPLEISSLGGPGNTLINV